MTAEALGERILSVIEQLGDEVRSLLAAGPGDSLEALGVLPPRRRRARSTRPRGRRRDVRHGGDRAWPAHCRNRRAADRGLSRDRWSSAHSKQLTLDRRRTPTGHDQPRGGIDRPFDHDRQHAASIRRPESSTRVVTPLRMRIAGNDMTVARHLSDLLGGDPARPELVERDIGGEELMDHVASDRHGLPRARSRQTAGAMCNRRLGCRREAFSARVGPHARCTSTSGATCSRCPRPHASLSPRRRSTARRWAARPCRSAAARGRGRPRGLAAPSLPLRRRARPPPGPGRAARTRP